MDTDAPIPLALAGGSLIFLLVVLLLLGVMIYTVATRSGSGISERPADGLGGHAGGDSAAPGAAGPDAISGRTEGGQDPFDTHGAA